MGNAATRKLLAFTSVVEAGTGVAALLFPALLVNLLLGLSISRDGIVTVRCFGIALVALSWACWPGQGIWRARQLRGMQIYNAGVAVYLGYLGALEQANGPLLWPAVALHAIVAGSLVWLTRAGLSATSSAPPASS